MAVLPTAKRRLSRRIPKSIQFAVRKHARQIGEIALAWNALQDALFVIFWTTATENRDDDYSIAYAIWHTFQSDRSQRELLMAVATANAKLPKGLVGHLKWAVDRASELSTFRNDAVHTPVRFIPISGGQPIPIPDEISARKQAVERLRRNPTARTWRLVRGDLIVLADFCNAIYGNIVVSGLSTTWPDRPRLLALPSKVRKRRKKFLNRKIPKPSHQL
jgi:hypothetical protein